MKICVFCSSSNALLPAYYDDARILAGILAARNHHLVYGGANVGLMNELASEHIRLGGKVTGIIPERISNKGLTFNGGAEIIITQDLRERKKLMEQHSDAFIAMPGGFGTLEEVLEVITLKQLQFFNKAVIFLNTNGFYDGLFAFFDTLFHQKFAKEEYRSYFTLTNSPEEAINYIENYEMHPFTDKWFNVNAGEFLSKEQNQKN